MVRIQKSLESGYQSSRSYSERARLAKGYKEGNYGPRRGDAGAVGGVSTMGRKNASDSATPALERMACTASECSSERVCGISPEDLADAVPLTKGGLLRVGNCESFAEDDVI